MIAPFDIFKAEAGGAVIWLGAEENLERAKARIQSMGTSKPGSYVILSQTTGNKLSFEVDSRGELRPRTTQSAT
jgi:hypothetical protein